MTSIRAVPAAVRQPARRHLCVVLGEQAAGQVQQWRRRWDPVMAAVAPAHVTVVYPEETAGEDLLLRRAEQLGAVARFRLRLGRVFAEDGGRGGVFVAVGDIDRGWRELRRRLLAGPMTPVDFPPHVTVAHPRTSSLGEECFAALAGRCLNAEVVVREVLFTETGGGGFTVLRRFPLAGAADGGW